MEVQYKEDGVYIKGWSRKQTETQKARQGLYAASGGLQDLVVAADQEKDEDLMELTLKALEVLDTIRDHLDVNYLWD